MQKELSNVKIAHHPDIEYKKLWPVFILVIPIWLLLREGHVCHNSVHISIKTWGKTVFTIYI